MVSALPTIFSPARRIAARQRMLRLQSAPEGADFILGDIVEDMVERLAFLRHEPKKSLIIGDTSSLRRTRMPLCFRVGPADDSAMQEITLKMVSEACDQLLTRNTTRRAG